MEEKLRTAKIVLRKKKHKELISFLYQMSVSSKNIYNSILFLKREEFFINQENTKGMNEDEKKKYYQNIEKLNQQDIYKKLLEKPKHFKEDGINYINHAIDYPRNATQQLIRKVENNFSSFKKAQNINNLSFN